MPNTTKPFISEEGFEKLCNAALDKYEDELFKAVESIKEEERRAEKLLEEHEAKQAEHFYFYEEDNDYHAQLADIDDSSDDDGEHYDDAPIDEYS